MIDVIGQIGTDPGSEWGTGDTSTLDNTIVRQSTITTGDSDGSDAFDPSVEWDGYAQDTTLHDLPLHLMDGARGDNDEAINGQITAPGAPAVTNIRTAISLSHFDNAAGMSQQLAGLGFLLLMISVGLWLYGKRKEA